MAKSNDHTVMGKITSVYGVKGWVKVFSYSQPKENIAQYTSWSIQRGNEKTSVQVSQIKAHGNGFVAKLAGCDDREIAARYRDFLILVPKEELPELAEGDYYWHQLEGLTVVSTAGENLGAVSHLMETGANDVLVVKPTKDSLDKRERLIPYLIEQVVKEVSLDSKMITVDWDSEF